MYYLYKAIHKSVVGFIFMAGICDDFFEFFFIAEKIRKNGGLQEIEIILNDLPTNDANALVKNVKGESM